MFCCKDEKRNNRCFGAVCILELFRLVRKRRFGGFKKCRKSIESGRSGIASVRSLEIYLTFRNLIMAKRRSRSTRYKATKRRSSVLLFWKWLDLLAGYCFQSFSHVFPTRFNVLKTSLPLPLRRRRMNCGVRKQKLREREERRGIPKHLL